jgi:hypothetical protein
MDERTPASGENLTRPTNLPPGYGSPQQASETQFAGKEEVRRLGGAARRRIIAEADKRKSLVASRLEQLADSLESSETQGPEGKLLDSAARIARNASSTLRNRSSEELLSNVEQGFRDRPGVFLAGCLALGFVGGRLLRA